MRITKESPLAEKQKVQRVLLNGKPLLDVIEFDTDEGWATVLLPVLPKTLEHSAPDPDELPAESNVGAFEDEEKTLHGTVTVELKEEEDAKA
jgi:hypothetical protein